MYEDLIGIATLRFNKELESISSHTGKNVREMQNKYAALTSSSGVRSGSQDAAIGRAQIEGSERLVRALYEIWVDLVKRRNGYISRHDMDFITEKLEGFSRTQKGHLHKAFSRQRMGAVVNLLTEEAGIRMDAATANARRDLAIMVREHELFLRSADSSKQKASGAVPANEDGRERQTGHRPEGSSAHHTPEGSTRGTIGKKVWSWVVVSFFVALALGLWGTFLTSGHSWAADAFYFVGALTFLAKFLTWEDARKQSGAMKKLLLGGMTILVLIFTTLALRWDHTINRVTSPTALQRPATTGTEALGYGSAHQGESALVESTPKEPPGQVDSPSIKGRAISTSERVKIIIAHQLQVNAAQLKSTDDFEANLGADPADVYFLMRSLEQEYNITIPGSDSTKLHTVGETISYIKRRVQEKPAQKHPVKNRPASSGPTPPIAAVAGPSAINRTPPLHYILESDFDAEVLRQSGPVLVFFCTEYRDPCRVMEPTISSIAKEQRGKLKTIAVDVNINEDLPKKYDAGYFQVPVIILFNGGAERGRIVGAASKEAIEHLIDNPQAFEKKAANQDPFESIPNVPESDFNSQVLKAKMPVLVYFYSPVEACNEVSPLVSQVASRHKGSLRVVRVDSYAESQLASEYDAGDYQDPLLILFNGGEARGVVKGTTSMATIENLIQRPESFPFRDDALPNVSATLAAVPDLDEADLVQTLKASRVPTLVYFYNDDKDPNCRVVASLVSAMTKLYKGRINFFKMDTSIARDISYRYDSWDGPSLVLFKGFKVKDRKSGTISKDDVTRILGKALNLK